LTTLSLATSAPSARLVLSVFVRESERGREREREREGGRERERGREREKKGGRERGGETTLSLATSAPSARLVPNRPFQVLN